MIDTTRATLLLFCERLGVPLADVLNRSDWYERVTHRLVIAGGDAFDVMTPETSDEDRRLILQAAAQVRRSVYYGPPQEE